MGKLIDVLNKDFYSRITHIKGTRKKVQCLAICTKDGFTICPNIIYDN